MDKDNKKVVFFSVFFLTAKDFTPEEILKAFAIHINLHITQKKRIKDNMDCFIILSFPGTDLMFFVLISMLIFLLLQKFWLQLGVKKFLLEMYFILLVFISSFCLSCLF